MKPLIVDTSVWVDWLRGKSLSLRDRTEGRLLYMSSIVAMELFSGARDTKSVQVVTDLVEPFSRHRRMLLPTEEDFRRAGLLMAQLKLPASKTSNDVLICLAARKIGAEVWTFNRSDFQSICKLLNVALDCGQ